MSLHYIASAFLQGADAFFIPCPLKYITGYDCPGCGFQRSLLALLKGDLHESLLLYPPTIPLLFTLIASLAANRLLAPHQSKKIISILYLITGFIIVANYSYKLMFAYHLS